MKLMLPKIALFSLSLISLASCAKGASDAELRKAYNLYIEAPAGLSKVLSTANSETLIAESLSNDSGSYIRTTEINQADKRVIITSTFKDYHPEGSSSITVNGTVQLKNLETNFFINGELTYTGIKPRTLAFKNIQLEQKSDETGAVFFPVGGYAVADGREISCEVLFTEIFK